jgi:hypothetical protein
VEKIYESCNILMTCYKQLSKKYGNLRKILLKIWQLWGSLFAKILGMSHTGFFLCQIHPKKEH